MSCDTLLNAAAICPDSVLLVTASASATDPPRQLLFTSPTTILCARSLADLPAIFERIQAALDRGHYAAGYFSYECGYAFEPTAFADYQPEPDSLPLAWFGIYPEPRVHNQPFHLTPDFAPLRLARAPDLTGGQAAYEQKVESIRRLIEAGETYQANLTDRVQSAFTGDPARLFAHMLATQPVAYAAMIHLDGAHILSASPELFFERSGSAIRVRPMKGTAARGLDLAEDKAQSDWLANDEKNRAENLMIVDLMRNDLGRICRAGSVVVDEMFVVDSLPTLLQMSSSVRGTLSDGVGWQEIFRALFPSGSIVGAPKPHTMRLLRQLEQRDRGVYTGAIGYFAPHDRAVFNVAIRTVVLRDGAATMGVGAGIVHDSEPTAEFRECQLKAGFLSRSHHDFQLIETMRWEDGQCALLVGHLARLASSATYFGFTFDCPRIEVELRAHAVALPQSVAHRLRLRLSCDGALDLTSVPIVPTDANGLATSGLVADRLATDGLVAIARARVNSISLWLRHKTTRRALYERARKAAIRRGLRDLLFVNEYGHVTEGTIHNLFLRHGDQWTTPPIRDGVLPGVCRQHLLDSAARQLVPNVAMPGLEERSCTLAMLHSADEIWLANAVTGPRRVSLDMTEFPEP